jgi:hypothetical protein
MKSETGKDLYAVAFRAAHKKWSKKKGRWVVQWKADIEYLHATSQSEAKFLFSAGNSVALVKRQMRIVAVGLAINFFVEDKQGLILSAS